MIGPRDAIEQAILISVGAAALTKDRAEEIVAELVARGHVGAQEGSAMIARLMASVRGEGPPNHGGVRGRVEDGVQALFRESGLARTSDLEDLRVRIAELERRVQLVEERPTGPGY
jgi:polyhydroxyalkanoate synthesis regulator phasin